VIFFPVPVCNLIKSLMLQEWTYASSIGCSVLQFLGNTKAEHG
jgi:hypothetical protein